jgi:hypothetical protein
MELIRTLRVDELGRVLLSELEGFTLRGRTDGIHSAFLPISRNGAAVLVPSIVIPYLRTLGRKVDREGFVLPQSSFVTLDSSTGAISPTRSTLDLPVNAVERLVQAAGAEAEVDRPVGEPSAVDTICVMEILESGPVAPISRGQALFHLARAVANLDALGETALEGVRNLVQTTSCYTLGEQLRPQEMLDALTLLTDGRAGAAAHPNQPVD